MRVENATFQKDPRKHLGVAQNSRARVTQILVFGSNSQGGHLGTFFEPQPFAGVRRTAVFEQCRFFLQARESVLFFNAGKLKCAKLLGSAFVSKTGASAFADVRLVDCCNTGRAVPVASAPEMEKISVMCQSAEPWSEATSFGRPSEFVFCTPGHVR